MQVLEGGGPRLELTALLDASGAAVVLGVFMPVVVVVTVEWTGVELGTVASVVCVDA